MAEKEQGSPLDLEEDGPYDLVVRVGWEFVGADRMPMLYDPTKCPELLQEQSLVVEALEQYCTENQVGVDEAMIRKGSEVQQAARATVAARRALLQQEQQEQEEEEDACGKAEEEELKEAARQKKERDIEAMLKTGPLADTVRVLHTPRGAKVYLLGTAHVSSKSHQDVVALIESVRPDTVMVELCHRRVDMITKEPTVSTKEEREAKLRGLFAELFDVITRGGRGDFIASIAIEIATLAGTMNIDVPNGFEFRIAALVGLRVGARIILGDRDTHITLGRLWAHVTLYEKAKAVVFLGLAMLTGGAGSPTAEEMEALKEDANAVEQINEVHKSLFPASGMAVMAERDEFLADSIKSCPGDTIVAVVGKGHMAGIEQHWQTDVNRAALLEVPEVEPGVAARALSWCFSTALGALCWTAGLFLPRGDQAAAEKKEQ